MEMRKAFFAALATATWFTSLAWSQTISGSVQGGLTNADGLWNHHPFALSYSSTGVFRFYWSCGNPDGICVITGLRSHFSTEPILYTIPPQQSVTSKGPVLLRLTARITCSPKAVLQDLPVAATRAMSMPFMPSVAPMAFHFLADFLADIFRRRPISGTPSPAVCDIQDPGVVMFNGTYYLFAEGIPEGSHGCSNSGNRACCHLYLQQY